MSDETELAQAPKILADLRVLVVEDNYQSMTLIKAMLRDFGMSQVYTAKDGKEALEFMGDCDDLIDLVLCDWNLPQMNGPELLQQIRTADPDLPFLMITGAADMQSVLDAKASGVSGYIRKPFSKEELQKKLNVMMRVLAHRA